MIAVGRCFDTSLAVATLATSATETTDLSQLSQSAMSEKNDITNIIDHRNAFGERAAIMEFGGEIPRDEAERLAAEDVGFPLVELKQELMEPQMIDQSVAPKTDGNGHGRGLTTETEGDALENLPSKTHGTLDV